MVSKKKSASFDYFAQNGAGAPMLSQNDSESGDSDSKGMFALPKRRIIRPKGSLSRRNGVLSCCRYCCVTILPVVVAFSVVGLVAFLVFLMLEMNGLQRDLEMFRLRISSVEADDASNLQASTKLQQDLNGKLTALANDEKEINEMRQNLETANKKIELLNQTLRSLQLGIAKAGSVASLAEDVKNLQKGMADTGVDISKLTDGQKNMKGKNEKLVDIVKQINEKIFNITAKILAKSSFGGMPPMPPAFPMPSNVGREESNKLTRLAESIRKETTERKLALTNHSNYMRMELYKVYSYVDVMNETCRLLHSQEEREMKNARNSSTQLKAGVHLLNMKVRALLGAIQQQNGSSAVDTTVLETRIRTLTDILDAHRGDIANITRRIASLETMAEEATREIEEPITPGTFSAPIASRTVAPDTTFASVTTGMDDTMSAADTTTASVTAGMDNTMTASLSDTTLSSTAMPTTISASSTLPLTVEETFEPLETTKKPTAAATNETTSNQTLTTEEEVTTVSPALNDTVQIQSTGAPSNESTTAALLEHGSTGSLLPTEPARRTIELPQLPKLDGDDDRDGEEDDIFRNVDGDSDF